MAKYLDPKNDLTFKRVFGEHKNLLISFLNALMPLEKGCLVETIEYLSPEQVPDIPGKKYSIVDVKCTDNHKRTFIVEMQMIWTAAFPQWLLFNTSKAYARQLEAGQDYAGLKPVYALALVDEDFDHKTDRFYHRYQLMDAENPADVIEGMEMVMVELKKLKPEKWEDRKLAVLWLRFLNEVHEKNPDVAEELLADESIKQAVELCERSAYTEKELEAYEKHWDAIRNEKMYIADALKKGEGIGIEKGEVIGVEKEKIATILRMYKKGKSSEDISDATGLSGEEVEAIIRQLKASGQITEKQERPSCSICKLDEIE
jgi:predicted transposase/invertase (TIGR01784 family)